jgi:outer membrane protein
MRSRIVSPICAFAIATVLSSPLSAQAQWLDVYGTRSRAADSPGAPLLRNTACAPALKDQPLALEDVIVQAICANPRAREAWANARAQAAAVGISESAYLPTLNATAGVERDTLSTAYDVEGFGQVDVPQNSNSKYAMLNLSWVLFDFGKRSAALRQARELLAAANASQDDALQAVFFNAAQAYYALRDAQAAGEAARQTEAVARESLAEATAKHDAGAGTLSDQLQAQTTYRRALLDRVSAEGDERGATGVLAAAMGFDANVSVHIVATDPTPERADFVEGIDQLIDEAKAHQPRLLAARAKLEAARANLDAMRAEGRPTISLVGDLARNNPSDQQQPQGLGASSISGSRGSTIGIQVTIPLFEGFASDYKVAQAEAQAEAQADAQEADLQNTELEVALDVWKSYQGLQTDTANLANSQDLLTDAQHSLEIARGRYKVGVGTFTELLDAQASLADAQKQRVLAISKWHTARLRLAAGLGSLGLWSTH